MVKLYTCIEHRNYYIAGYRCYGPSFWNIHIIAISTQTRNLTGVLQFIHAGSVLIISQSLGIHICRS